MEARHRLLRLRSSSNTPGTPKTALSPTTNARDGAPGATSGHVVPLGQRPIGIPDIATTNVPTPTKENTMPKAVARLK
jgi:hypothetical protein